MWNMQSGIQRKNFDIGPCLPVTTKKASERCVTGLASDSLNRVVIASTLDGTINVRLYLLFQFIINSNELPFLQFFDFHSTKLEHTLVLPSAAVSISLHRDSNLLAVVCDDMIVRIVDIETRRVVRDLGGFRGRVLDIVCVSPLFYSFGYLR
jgi:U3 small nucleolar RNA-associated protein 21